MLTDATPPSAPTVLISENWAASSTSAARTLVADPRIVEGVAAMMAETAPATGAANQQGDLQKVVYGAAAAEKFSRDFSSAKVPSCGGNDALKFQPARIGPVGVGGFLAIPFMAIAAVRGKCLFR
jgi:hypothetical protein